MNERNSNQITRKDAKNCFVESLNDTFRYGKIHFSFATYDVTKPEGSRQTNSVHIYIDVDNFLEVCRKMECGELKYQLQNQKKLGDTRALYECMGGTSAQKLAMQNRARADGKSLSRVLKIVPGSVSDLLMIADSGSGEETATGLIAPKFGNKPENHVAVSMKYEALSELFLSTKLHYQAWLTAQYLKEQNQNLIECLKNGTK